MNEKEVSKDIDDNAKKQNKCRCVYSAPVARKLIRRGFAVVDIKPDKYNRDKTVFVFEETEKFKSALADVISEYEKRKNENEKINRWYGERLDTIFTSHDLKPNKDVFEIGHPLYDPAREWTIDWDCD